MQTELTPYLIFDGQCKDAFETYATVLDGAVTIAMPREDAPERVGHCRLEADGLLLHGMDAAPGSEAQLAALLYTLPSAREAQTAFDTLMQAGSVAARLQPTPNGGTFSMGVDAYGVRWMITSLADSDTERTT